MIVHSQGVSAAVRMWLDVDGQLFPVGSVSRGQLILRQETSIKVDSADLVISVDGDEVTYPIDLPNGILGREVAFTDRFVCKLPLNSENNISQLPF